MAPVLRTRVDTRSEQYAANRAAILAALADIDALYGHHERNCACYLENNHFLLPSLVRYGGSTPALQAADDLGERGGRVYGCCSIATELPQTSAKTRRKFNVKCKESPTML